MTNPEGSLVASEEQRREGKRREVHGIGPDGPGPYEIRPYQIVRSDHQGPCIPTHSTSNSTDIVPHFTSNKPPFPKNVNHCLRSGSAAREDSGSSSSIAPPAPPAVGDDDVRRHVLPQAFEMTLARGGKRRRSIRTRRGGRLFCATWSRRAPRRRGRK